MVVIRESDEHDLTMFNGMREQTLQLLSHVPAIAAIHAAGMAPMTCGDSFVITTRGKKGQLETITIPVRTLPGSPNTRLFSYGGYVHLWSMSSAAKENDAGINAFTQVLVDCLEEYKPVEVYAANISRLVRSQQQAALLLRALLNKVDIVWAGSVPFHFKGAAAQTGMLLFSVIAMMSAIERDWIVQRLMCGRIAAWRAGKWPFGNSFVPFGYRFDPDSERLEVDFSLVDTVREMLEILGQLDVPDKEMARQLGAIGVTSSRPPADGEDERRNIALLTSPRSALDSLYACAPLWIHGEYLLRQRNGFQGLKNINGLTVVRAGDDEVADQLESLGLMDDLDALLQDGESEADMFGIDDDTFNVIEETFRNLDEDCGEIQMLYKFSVPEGGWAEPNVLLAFATAALARHERLAPKRTSMRPISDEVRAASADAHLHATLLNGTHARGTDKVSTDRRDRARARKDVPPLTGRSWTRDNMVYETRSHSKRYIEVHMMPAHTDKPVTGKRITAHDGTIASRSIAYQQQVARFPYDLVIRNMVRAIAHAIRTGVPVDLLHDTSMSKQVLRRLNPDTLQIAIGQAERARQKAEMTVARAASEVLATEDETLRAQYRAQAELAATKLREAQAKVDELRARVLVAAQPVEEFETNVEVMMATLQRLLTCQNTVTQAEYLALKTFLRRLRIDRADDGQWWGETHLHFATETGVVEFGPIRFNLGDGGAAAGLLMDSTLDVELHHPNWIELELTKTGKLNPAAVRTLRLHQFKQVAYVVLDALDAHPLPDWVGEQWRDPAYTAWVVNHYTDPDFNWDRSAAKVSIERQFIVHLVNRHGSASLTEYALHSPPRTPQAFSLVSKAAKWGNNVRSWQPSIQPVDSRRTKARRYEPLLCACGLPLRTVARFAEVLTDMLCDCRRMAGVVPAGVQIPDDLRFPDEYLAAAPGWEACLAELRRKAEVGARGLRGRTEKVLVCNALREGGHIAKDIAASAGVSVSAASEELRMLKSYGFVETGYFRTAKSPEWHLTAEGRVRADEIRDRSRETAGAE